MRTAAGLVLAVVALLGGCITRMPGASFSGPLPEVTPAQLALAGELERDVRTLADEIGPRNVGHPAALREAERYLIAEFESAGYDVQRQTYLVDGVECSNLIAEYRGDIRPDEIIVVGGHYDTCRHSPGANDNATGVAATLALARMLGDASPGRTMRFVLFVNEEPPYFWTRNMGSLVYAEACRARGDDIRGMLSLETMGCYLDEPRSQRYPPPFSLFYPNTGNFIAFIGNYDSRELVRAAVRSFREHADFPSEGAVLTMLVPRVGSSDHWSFWKQGYPALMVTDTAPYRYRHYHKPTDTPDKVDFERLARVVEGLQHVIRELATP